MQQGNRTPIGGGSGRAPLGGARPGVPLQAPGGQPARPVQPVQVQAVNPQQMTPQQMQQMQQQQMQQQQLQQQQQQQQLAQSQQGQRPQSATPGVSVTGGMRPGMANPNDPNLKPIERLFALMAQYDSSDLHLKSDCPVIMRIKGEMRALQGNPLSSDEIHRLLSGITTDAQIKLYDETGDLDFAHRLPDQARSRFRLNCFRDRGKNALVARRIATDIPTFEQLNLPVGSMQKIVEADDGLIVLAGVTGSGKSTTIAGMIDWINSHHAKHIVTVEDPIEYEFKNKRSFISQREIGTDCVDFKAAIRTMVRQDPDVILIGEMRDQETFEFGMVAAETGHLVFGTLHAGTVAQSIGRILGLFPTEKHGILRQGLSFNLRSIVCQKLVPSPQFGRIPINEILIANAIVKKMLLEGEDGKLTGIVRGAKQEGMMTFDQCLLERCKAGYVTDEIGLEYAQNPDQFRLALQGIDLGGGKGGIV